MKRMLIIFYSLLTTLFISSASFGQKVTADTRLDTTRILIGDQIKLMLEVNQQKDGKVQFPLLADTIITNIEIIDISPIDTSPAQDGSLNLRQWITITSFDTGFYVIPSLYFYDQIQFDSIKTRAWPLEVFTMEIDTTKGITDIKLPYDVPLSFWEIAPYIIVGILLIGIAILIWYIRRKRKMAPIEEVVRIKPTEPAHLWALRHLDSLSSEKLWQKGKIKLFHSRLSEIFRTYLEFRFDIMAMEQTTPEILSDCENLPEIDGDFRANMQEMLDLSDLVKFAKWPPLPDENERAMQFAYDFVLKTKKVVNLREEKDEEVKAEPKGEEESK